MLVVGEVSVQRFIVSVKVEQHTHICYWTHTGCYGNQIVCVISHMGHCTDGSEPQTGKQRRGRDGQNEIQKVWERQTEGEKAQSRQRGSVM